MYYYNIYIKSIGSGKKCTLVQQTFHEKNTNKNRGKEMNA